MCVISSWLDVMIEITVGVWGWQLVRCGELPVSVCVVGQSISKGFTKKYKIMGVWLRS